jgi:hypothetical protein
MAAIVVPFDCLSRARTVACLVPLRAEREGIFPGFTGLLVRLLGRGSLVLFGVLLCDILGSLSVATATGAVTTEAPQWRHRQRGKIQIGPTGPYRHDTDAPLAAEVQSLLPGIRRTDHPPVALKSRLRGLSRLWIREFESSGPSHPVPSPYRTSISQKCSRYFGTLALKSQSLSGKISGGRALIGSFWRAVSIGEFSISENCSPRLGSHVAETSSHIRFRA